ncbi:ribonuclease H-like domain-containing protein [Tanacetum coccineum]|uniref:Ribonuclease H-like domain-containing protein n=1 Tax=Tanacetum coccineum TaxID=301880 RepID=A0ABQ5EU93_9ASTR
MVVVVGECEEGNGVYCWQRVDKVVVGRRRYGGVMVVDDGESGSKFFNFNSKISTYSVFVGWIIDFGANQHMTFTTTFLFNIIDVSHLDNIVAHPNGTKAKVNQIRSCKLNDNLVIHDVLVKPGYQVSLLFVSKLAKDNKLPTFVLSGKSPYELVFNCKPKLSHLRSNDPNDDLRVNNKGGRTNPSSVEAAIESADADLCPTTDPSTSTSNESLDKSGSKSTYDVNSEMLGSITTQGLINDGGATPKDDMFNSEGEDLDLYNLDMLFQSNEGDNEHNSVGGLRRSSRKFVVPNKFNDYVLNKKAKYGLDKAIRSKWIFKVKYKSTGEVERFKARLVAKGFSQKEEINYKETFSPVMKMVTVRCLLSLAVQKGWVVYQLDINNAFLYREIVEDSKNDFSLYTKSAGESFVMLLVYVDDILITGNDMTEINNCKKLLNSKFMIKDLGVLKYFLGIEVPNPLRPGISYVVHKLSQVMHSLKQFDFRLTFKVPRCDICKIFGHIHDQCPNKVVTPPIVSTSNVVTPTVVKANDGFQMVGKNKKKKGKSKSTNGGQFVGLMVKQNVRYEPKANTSAPKKRATNEGNSSIPSSRLKSTRTSSNNITSSNSFSALNVEEEDEGEVVENVYDEMANLFSNTKPGGGYAFMTDVGLLGSVSANSLKDPADGL